MAIQLQDRILTLCTTVGTNDAIVGATKEGYQGWEGITLGNTVYYCITDDTAWEVGYGQYLSRAGTPTIQRNVLDSNTGEKLDLSGNASIFCTYPSEKAVFLNADDNMYYPTTNINASKFIGDGSALTNLPNDNVWKDNGSSIEYKGDGSTTTQVWAENNGKYAKVIQKSDGQSYFKGDGATFFGTESDLPVNIFVGGTNQLAVAKDSVYSFQPVTAPSFIGDGSKLTGLPPSGIPEAPEDNETYARNNATWVSISDSSGIPDAPVDGLMYGRQDGEWNPVADASDVYTKTETNTLLDEKADKATTYTKTEVDVIDNAQDAKIVINNDEIARQQIEITNNSANITKNDGAINTNITNIATNTGNIATNTSNISSNTSAIGTNTTNIATNTSNISSNTTAIGTLSGQVGQNSEDIAELQDSIFFTSAYSADYPESPNRDPENGNMYLQNVALFTYSYASATQIFCSKTDESGNVRQFTAVKPGDSIVLNEVDSPNYGRYELVTVEDVSDSYVVMNVIPKMGQGTVITGVKVAFQAFPQPGSNSIWTEIIDSTLVAPEATYAGNIVVRDVNIGTGANGNKSNAVLGRNATGSDKNISGYNNVAIGDDAFSSMEGANNSVAVGYHALESNTTGPGNVAVGGEALLSNVEGKNNTAIGYFAGGTMTSGDNNILLGNNAQTSADGVSNEVTIGNDNITKTRLNGNVVTEGGFYGNSLTVSDGTSVSYNSANDSIQYNSNVGNRWVIAGSTSMLLTKTAGEDATLRVPGLSTAVSTAVPNICVSSSGVFQRTTGTSGPGTGVIKQVLFNATDENVIIDDTLNDQWVSLKSDITITPGSTDSRVLLNFASSISMSSGPNDKIGIRRSTDNEIITEWVGANTNGDNPSLTPLDYLDSPNTTSAVTYTLMGYASGNSVIMINKNGSTNSTVTAMEVGNDSTSALMTRLDSLEKQFKALK